MILSCSYDAYIIPPFFSPWSPLLQSKKKTLEIKKKNQEKTASNCPKHHNHLPFIFISLSTIFYCKLPAQAFIDSLLVTTTGGTAT
jgi:hypothetical protein